MVARRGRRIKTTLRGLDLSSEGPPIKPSMPWRYNPDLVEDDQWDVYCAVDPSYLFSPYSTLEILRYFPGDREIPMEGAWIWILRPPFTPVENEHR